MAFSTIFLNNIFSLLTGSAIVVFGFEPMMTYGKDLVDGYHKNVQLNLDFLFGGNTNDKSSDSTWLERYCVSKVGVTRFGFPCDLTMEQKHKKLPRNCVEVQSRGYYTSGLYEIQPDRNKFSFMALCDMEIKGGGWTHIHKRFDGSVDFNLGWREYKFGFGDLNGEFWIGLENMHSLTGIPNFTISTYGLLYGNNERCEIRKYHGYTLMNVVYDINRNELLVELVDRRNGYGFAQYNEFRIGSEPDGYPLDRLSGFSGDAGDSLNWHKGMKFTTKDVDQDLYNEDNCANYSSGAYWYNNCFASNLNGELINHDVLPSRERQGMIWDSFRSRSYVLAKARMLIRPYSPK